MIKLSYRNAVHAVHTLCKVFYIADYLTLVLALFPKFFVP